MYTVESIRTMLRWLTRGKNYTLNVDTWVHKIEKDVRVTYSLGKEKQFDALALWDYLINDPLIDCLILSENVDSIDELLYRATEYYSGSKVPGVFAMNAFS